MVTKRKSELSKTVGAFHRAFEQAGQSLPQAVRTHWKTILFPIRLVPTPVALALIALVALAMILYPPVDEQPLSDGFATECVTTERTYHDGTSEINAYGVCAAPSTIGGQDVPAGLDCEEDETIGFVGIPDTLVCVHYENYAEQDAGGCVRPAFYVEAAGACVLAVPPASTPVSTVTPTATPTATPVSTITAPSAGMGIVAR